MARYPLSQISGLKQYFIHYLEEKKAPLLVGEFIDEQGIQGKQFGILGACFALSIARSENLKGPVLDNTRTLLLDAFKRSPDDRSAEQDQLMKDFGRITSKTAIALLVVDENQAQAILRLILDQGVSNRLIRPVLDDVTMTGDVLITAFVFHIIHIAKIFISESDRAILNQIALRLKDELDTSNHSLARQLFISSGLCLFDYATYINDHTWLVNHLYANKGQQLRGLHLDSPFTEIFYEDGSRLVPARTRYVRIPKIYTALLAIYLVIRDERLFFKFPAVRQILREIQIPYSAFVASDRNRSAMYYVFFLYLTLHPSKHFLVPDRKRGEYIAHWWKFYFRNMTWQSWIGLAIAAGCLVGSLYLVLHGLFSTPMDIAEIKSGALLFVFGFATSLLRAFGGRRE